MHRFRRLVAVALLSCVTLQVTTAPVVAGNTENELNEKTLTLYRQKKYKEAIASNQKLITFTRRKYGENHLRFAESVASLGMIYFAEGRYVEAEASLNRAIAIHENKLGVEAPELIPYLDRLGDVYVNSFRYGDAEDRYKRALNIMEKAIRERGGDSNPADELSLLAGLYLRQGRYREAEPLLKRALEVNRNAFLGVPLIQGLSDLLLAEGRDEEAIPFLQSLVSDDLDELFGPGNGFTANAIYTLASLYIKKDRYNEAEALLEDGLQMYNNPARTANPIVERTTRAELSYAQGRYAEAEEFHKQAIALAEKFYGRENVNVATALDNLAQLYTSSSRHMEAAATYERALAIREKARTAGKLSIAMNLVNLGNALGRAGRHAEAERLIVRALAIYERIPVPETTLSDALGYLGALHAERHDWAGSVEALRRSTAILVRRGKRGGFGEGATAKQVAAPVMAKWQFHTFIDTAYQLAHEGGDEPALTRETFQIAQWTLASEAGQSLGEMALRTSTTDPAIKRLIRERQDLLLEWQVQDQTRTRGLLGAKDAAALQEIVQRLGAIDRRIVEIDRTLEAADPRISLLSQPGVLSVEEVQQELHDGEVLVLFLELPEPRPGAVWSTSATFIWVVTKTEVRWLRSSLDVKTLKADMTALRCGLSEDEWSGLSGAARCSSLLGTGMPVSNAPLPFNLGIAHKLYVGLFGQIDSLVQKKQIIIVTSAELGSLPFHILVTKQPRIALPETFDDFRGVAWLARTNAVSILPSVANLKQLRRYAKRSVATKPYIGYGDPVLEGRCGKAQSPVKDCVRANTVGATADQAGSARTSRRASGATRITGEGSNMDDVFANGATMNAVLGRVRALCALPDSAYEIRCAGKRLGASEDEIRLGDSATEADIKDLSSSGALASYRIVHMATHGLLAGDFEQITRRQGEPALVMTPPKVPKDDNDDGLLTASEIAQLKLDADLVVLSACNTASGDKPGGEALSGLARAFFYAGARALLVSHWPVYSDAAVRLATATFNEMTSGRGAARSEALRQAMVSLMDDRSEEDNAHPSVWAPFVIVGEE
jgi:CHAT domain-containing protein/tetratricopeptide (TPR) repeat protein